MQKVLIPSVDWDNLDCVECSHLQKCEAEYGKIGIDREDCRAIMGTHFCLATWEPFFKYICKAQNKE